MAVTIRDHKGDSLAYPKAVLVLPFADASTTAGRADDYAVVCGPGEAGDAGGAPDAVYYFKPAQDVTVTASLCGSAGLASTFDSRLYLLSDVDAGGALRADACSNDACGTLPSLTVRLLQRRPGARARAWPPSLACCPAHPCTPNPAPLLSPPLPTRPQAALKAGVAYAFVVDGVNGAAGKYSIR